MKRIEQNLIRALIDLSRPPLAIVLPSECQSTARTDPICALNFLSCIVGFLMSHFLNTKYLIMNHFYEL